MVRRLNTGIAIGGLLLWGCAKFPAGGSGIGNTRLQFHFEIAGAVNPNYIYVVAIRVLTPPVGNDTTLSDPGNGPIPVVTTGSKNGIVEGLPTHYVIYTPNDPNVYEVYRFPTREEEGSSADPNDPSAIDLRWPGILVGPVLPGSAINPQNPDGTYGSTLGFTIDTSYLDQHASNAQAIQTIQFNVLTMNVPATSAGNVQERVIDAIGDQSTSPNSTSFKTFIQRSLTQTGEVSSDDGITPEPVGDTYPVSPFPAVDLSEWKLTVIPP